MADIKDLIKQYELAQERYQWALRHVRHCKEVVNRTHAAVLSHELTRDAAEKRREKYLVYQQEHRSLMNKFIGLLGIEITTTNLGDPDEKR